EIGHYVFSLMVDLWTFTDSIEDIGAMACIGAITSKCDRSYYSLDIDHTPFFSGQLPKLLPLSSRYEN
ncbi:MAG: hypothetical protein LUQ22_04285, partial [Methanotrichaceae archaeon]|nr:hypothetical protein [Methanotrichaceae archaeon]